MFGRFSRRTVNCAIDVLGQLTHAQLTALLIDLGPRVYEEIRDENVSLAKRLNDLKVFLDRNPEAKADGEFLDEVLVAKAVSLFPKEEQPRPWSAPEPMPLPMQKLARLLEGDGFVVQDRNLRPAMPVDLGLPAAESELVRLLRLYGFTTPLGHLEEAFDNHARGNWASANSQLRTFLEGLLEAIAVHLDPAAVNLPTSENRRARLAQLGFLSRDLNEWSDDGKHFVGGLFKRLHPNGSHPGLSDSEDCTYRMHLVLLTTALFMRRLSGWPKAKLR